MMELFMAVLAGIAWVWAVAGWWVAGALVLVVAAFLVGERREDRKVEQGREAG